MSSPFPSLHDPISSRSVRYVAPKDMLAGYLLWFFLGVFGVHRFYTGRWITGLLWLFTGGLAGVGWVFDAFWTHHMVRNPK